MPYAEGRTIYDADSHIMEWPEWLLDYADPAIRPRMKPLFVASVKPGEETFIERERRRHADPAERPAAEAEIMLRKNWSALGSFIPADRSRALDLLGFQRQLVFNTFANTHLVRLEHGPDLELAYGTARAHNRAMLDFCRADRRLLPVCYVPLAEFGAARAIAEEALAAGAKALMVPSACPATHSPSHTGLFPVWALAEEAGVPVVFHVGGGGQLLSPMYFENGLPPVPDFHGGAENFRSVDYMAIPGPPMQTLATMIFDGIFDRFPRLRVGVIEQGAVWVPSWMRNMDCALEAFSKNEARLRALALRPSEYVRRQIRVTPYPAEPVGWIIAQAGEEICMFSSDWPHVEGGRNPIKRFEASLAGMPERAVQRFYADNFVDLMGPALG
ncbi:MAG TPA: amidohydrolase family protein [Candidatus Limnocylindria bacterium]|nr:amidohydrolase family protein [Candidatus Limnocylindria bacterium]